MIDDYGMVGCRATFVAFLGTGLVPLFPFLLPLRLEGRKIFLLSTIATMVTFFLIGVAKGRVLERSLLRSRLETGGRRRPQPSWPTALEPPCTRCWGRNPCWRL